MKINVLVLDGVFDTGLATVCDVFTTASDLRGMLPTPAPRFDVTLIGVRRRVRTARGLTVPVIPADEAGDADWLIVPAISDKMPEPLAVALDRRDIRDAFEVLGVQAERGGKIAAACIGTFVLAESGLLHGHSATTSWWLAPMFCQRYPKVRLEQSRMVVQSGQFVTAGAALGHVDLALGIVRQISPELAALVSRYLIIDSRASQSIYVIHDHLVHADPLVERFERWARGNLAAGFSLDEAARAVGTSKRTLARRTQQVLSKSPLSYVQDLRIERAVHLLKTSGESLEQIAAQVGYSDGVTLRTLMRERLGRGVRELRVA